MMTTVSADKKAKTKYELMVLPRLEEIGKWAASGVTDAEITKGLGISKSSFENYKKKYPELAEQLQKRFTAVRDVENSLYLKAMGRIVTLNKPLKVKKIQYSETGRKLAEEERIEIVEEEVYFPPETSAIKFFLTNVEPEKWKNNRDDDCANEDIVIRFGSEGGADYGD